MRRVRSAFTLIELMVVVAIIGLLIGITMPSLKEARRIARKTVCKKNLSQIGVGVHEYLMVHRDTFPSMCRLPSYEPRVARVERREEWPAMPVGLKAELAGKNEVYLCPSDQNAKSPELGHPRYFDSEETSYEWESQLNGLRLDFKGARVLQGLVFAKPQDIWLSFDFEAFHGGDNTRGSHNALYADLRVQSDDWNLAKKVGSALPTPP